jgi:dTDP-4-amino-4,6-dideoxygalactose transaminase
MEASNDEIIAMQLALASSEGIWAEATAALGLAALKKLRERGVGSGIYYPIPVHRQKPFVELGYGAQSFAVTERLTEQVVSIPVHPSLSDDEVSAVIAAVNQTADELGTLAAEAVGA